MDLGVCLLIRDCFTFHFLHTSFTFLFLQQNVTLDTILQVSVHIVQAFHCLSKMFQQ